MSDSEPNPASRLVLTIYEQLRRQAQQAMRNERAGHTLTATALVHEAYLKIEGSPFENKRHFYASAAEAMRQILIDHARARQAEKRGGDRRKLDVAELGDVADLAKTDRVDEIMALDEAVLRLSDKDPQAAEIVKLRFYAGLSINETAEAMGISPRTVKRDWQIARAFLFRDISGVSGDQDVPESV